MVTARSGRRTLFTYRRTLTTGGGFDPCAGTVTGAEASLNLSR